MKIEDLLCGKVIAVVVFIAVTITEIYLSHQNGKDSGTASRSLSTRIHISEKMLRTGAHMISFAVMKNGRHCSIKDIEWNLLGVAVGCGVWMIVSH